LDLACKEVLWKPHWEAGGGYAGCGAWLRATWVATVGSCGVPEPLSTCDVTFGHHGKGFELWDIMWAVWAAVAACSVLLLAFCLKRCGERCCRKRLPLFASASTSKSSRRGASETGKLAQQEEAGVETPDAGSFAV